MAHMNKNFKNLKQNYLFIEIAGRIRAFCEANPDKSSKLIRMGIGDVTLPLVPAVVVAGQKAFAEMGVAETFRGYEDSGRGYAFLREAVAGYYSAFGAIIDTDEIFISDGAKSDTGNIGDIFADDCDVVVTDPAYPVYVDSSIMGGRRVIFADFDSPIPVQDGLIYLCSPNNPTGQAYTHAQLQAWVDVALKSNAVIVYDAAYEAFISEPDKIRSIFELPDARKCAVEIASLSKTAGFTGTRCGYTIVPKELTLSDGEGGSVSLSQLWARRQGSKFNGVSYPVQRAAEAVFSAEGQAQIRENIAIYRKNAEIIMAALHELNIPFT
ncbi:MAG: aminotransferase class I/II-fold pyridoxal phosphate-dependent enzyme, partial [Oscillospiraceae bacterium]|nr:aminotransferase class I/II-fold pyridoxal phosphate-dependent enzyme [Oscillospiraceae bacterium]